MDGARTPPSDNALNANLRDLHAERFLDGASKLELARCPRGRGEAIGVDWRRDRMG